MAFDTKTFAARWYAGQLFPEDVPRLAADALEAGFDGPALRRLAGLTRPTSIDVQPWIQSALKEVGQVEPLTPKQALIELGRNVAQRIVDGSLAPLEGCRTLAVYAMCAAYPAELVEFFQIDDEADWGEYGRSRKAREDAVLVEARRLLNQSLT